MNATEQVNVTVMEPPGRPASPALPPAASSETSAIINMVERASRDPTVDLDKMERLMKMRKEVIAEDAERAFNMAMRAAQAAMRPISADAENPQTRSKYATYAKLDRELRPIYTSHGFSLSFDEADCPKPDHIRVLCYVSHDGGHTRTYRKDMPADGKGPKGNDVMSKTHATGAAASYGARYLLKGIFNIAVGEDDRDGNEPPQHVETLSEDQIAKLRDLIEATGANEAKFKAFIKVGSLAEIRADKFDAAVKLLQQKQRRTS